MTRPLLALTLTMLVVGCSHRLVPSTVDGGLAQDDRSDGAIPSTSSACTLRPGVHGSGDFDATAPDIDQPKASFTTDQSTIELTVWIKKGVSVSLYAKRPSTNPVLPQRLQLENLPAGQDWDVTLQHAWCNAMECRIDFHGTSHEPTDRLEGWVELKRPPDATETLFSNLSLMVACVTGSDSGKRSLTMNVVAGRQ